MNRAETNSQLNAFQLMALVVGVIGIALLALGFFLSAEQFFQSYLFGYLFCLSLPLGCFGLMLLQHLTGGTWGLATRRLLEAGAMTLPVMGLLFIPIALSVTGVYGQEGILYHWSNPEALEDPFIAHKAPYLNSQFFILRAVIYFVIWAGIAFLIRRWSLEQDQTGNPKLPARMRVLSGLGVIFFVVTVTLAMTDWGMSLDPHWFSTMYGPMFMVGEGLITLAFMIVMMRLLLNTEPMAGVVSTKQVHDVGKLMLAFTVLWAYVSFSQYLIIWSGNVAEFTPWYVRRAEGGWEWFPIVLIIFHFFLPFFLLLSRRRKKNVALLGSVAIFIIFMRLVDMSWLILPEFHETVIAVSWTDLVAPLGLLGLWITIFLWIVKRRPLLPYNDPGMVDFAIGGGHH
ncbi:MAG: hypothetical protein MI924_25280 [Chloroflexales bacterium]|nr:hypothetical protein [Chloroflexales bacterium]